MNEIIDDKTAKIVVKSYPTLVKMEQFLTLAVPDEMCAKRLVRLFYVELAKNQKLNDCTTDSICGAIMTCAQYGLEPGIAGMIYLIPRGGKMTLMLGYRGMIEMSHRSGKVSAVESFAVYEKDNFSISGGTEPKIHHTWDMGSRGKMLGVYSIVTMKDGYKQFASMNVEEIEAVRRRSSSPFSGPWVTDYEQMAMKTVIKRLLKLTPTSVSLSSAISMDDANDYDGQNLDAIGRAALFEANIDNNVIDIQSQSSQKTQDSTQSDKLAEKISGMGE